MELKGFTQTLVVGRLCMPHWININKTLLTMKLTAFIVLSVVCLQVSAKSVAQEKVTLSEHNTALETVLQKIFDQTGYQYIFKVQGAKDIKVTIDVKDRPIDEVLPMFFQGKPFTYEIVNKIIVVKKINTGNETTEKLLNEDPVPIVIARGMVYNEVGQPLAGANITEKKSRRGTITNVKGEFEMVAVPANSVLIISFIGYAPQQVTIKDAEKVQVYLNVAKNELDKVVIQAYGTTTQRLATGNIATVTAAEIEKQPVMNPLLALQGRVPGLIVSQVNGFASAPIKVEIRGRNSINNNFTGEPLYVIDGVPLTVVEVGGNSSYGGGSSGFLQNGMAGPAGGQSPLFSTNPSDIESIEVLKDADATSIYGSRGSNGVILITTKKGKAGKTKFTMNIQQGISKITKYYNMLNTPQYLQMRREAFNNDSIIPDPGTAPDLLVWDTTRYTNWQKQIWGGTGKNTNVQMGLSGGNAQTSFRIGAGYTHTTNILTTSGADQNASVSLNVNHRSINQKLDIILTTSYAFTQSNIISLPSAAVTLPPNAPAIFDVKGNLNYAAWQPATNDFFFGSLLQPYTSKTNFINSNFIIAFQPLQGLTLKSSFGYNNSQNNQTAFTPIASLDPSSSPFGTATFGDNFNKNWIVEPQLEYSHYIGKGRLNFLLGGTLQEGATDGIQIAGHGYTNDALLRTISNAPSQTSIDNYGQYRYSAIFSRLNYNWQNKYIINLTARRDGSSNFGPTNQFGNFGSLGAAWIFTEEQWVKGAFKILSFGKLRGSYGSTGGEGPAYGYITRWQSVYPNYNAIVPLVPTQHANPNYHWQINKKLEAAMELGFLQDRLTIGVVYYQNRCGNQIVAYPTPEYTGFTSVTANSPALVQNTGWEFSSNLKIINTKKTAFTIYGNISFNRNKLVSYPNFEFSPYTNSLTVGKSLNNIKLLHYTGVDPQTGQYVLLDKNHDGMISISPDSTDDRFDYDKTPKFTGGFGMSFSYERFSLNLFFSFRKAIGVNALAFLLPGNMMNAPVGVLARWQKPGDVTNVARFTTNPQNSDSYYSQSSDGIYTDASFIRLTNATFSYSLADKTIKKIGMAGCSLFIHAQNLFVITKYKGIDPETQNFGGMPPAKIITMGLSCSF
ncbi:MAG TPA: SusC/RagA family TonB-linked outer membrane protein [Puia sp.]|nr:SusC/RagA family TonB-linked outer membrane protein [Puia sp.]